MLFFKDPHLFLPLYVYMLNRYFITDDPAKYTRTYTLPDLKDSFSIPQREMPVC